MKEGIHPAYEVATVTCACGNTFATRSTKTEIRVDICSACHPFFTGRQKLLDTAGRVDRFKKRFAKTEGRMVARAPKAAARKKTEALPQRAKVLRSTPVKKAPPKPGAKAPKADKPAKKTA